MVDEIWNDLKNSLLNAGGKVTCGFTKKGRCKRQTWRWDDTVNVAIEEKRRVWKVWKMGDGKQDYPNAKRVTKHAVFVAKKNGGKNRLSDVNKDPENVFRFGKEMRRETKV